MPGQPTGLGLPSVLGNDDPQKMATLHAIGPFFIVLFAVWFFYLLRKDLFQDKSVAYVALAGFTFSVTSVSMHTLNKAVVGFTHQPSIITSIQMVVAMVVMLAWHGGDLLKADRKQMWQWCLVPIAYAAMLNSSLFGYEYISLTLMTVFRNLAPLVTMVVESFIMAPEHRPSITLPVIAAICVMIVGALLFSWGESAFSWIGLGLVMLNTLLAILDRVLQRRLLVQECKDLAIPVCMIINNSFGVLPSLMLAWASNEFHGFEESATNWRDPAIIMLVIMSGFMGLFIGLAGLMCQKAMSATSFQVLQNGSKVVVVGMGVSIFGDKLDSSPKVIGMFLSLAGSAAYGYARVLESAEARKGELSALVKHDVGHKA